MMRCVVIDDEPLARECMVNYITKIDSLKLVGTGENPLELSKFMDRETVDLLLLDVHMPVMNGIDYLKATKKRPLVILTTAYPSYALQGYELEVIDYLLKPITFNRFFKAVSKASDYHALQKKETPTANEEDKDFFFVKCNLAYEKIHFHMIQYIEAQENYVAIYTREQKYMVLMPIKRIEELLGADFLRVHKSYIVAIDKIKSVEKDKLYIGSQVIPISRNYRTKVLEVVVEERVWRK